MSYNLDEQPESFEFVVGGNAYNFRYPTTEEMAEAQKLEDDAEKEAQVNWLFTFITPVKPEAPSIAEAMKKVSFKVVQAFNDMISEQFSIKS